MIKHGGRFLSPCSFFAKQRKSTDHTDDTDLSCVGAPEKVTQKSIIGLFSLSHEQNKARFNYAMARKQRRMPI